MATTTNNCRNIGIVKGNDVVLKLWLYTRELQNRETLRVPLNIGADDAFKVDLCKIYSKQTLRSSRDGTDDNCLIVNIPWTTAIGVYTLEVAIERDGKHLCSVDCGRISIVGCNSEASPTLERVNTSWQAGMEVDMQIAFSAVVHGENAYEMWRKLPGNENKTLQDFIDEVLSLNQNATAARRATRDADAAAVLANEKARVAEMAAANAKADYVGEDNYVRRWNPVTQQYEKTDIYVKGDRGNDFTYEDFTPGQITELQRPATEIAKEVEAAEKLRKQAETARNDAEGTRLANETTRENNERIRQSNTSAAISKANAAADKIQTASFAVDAEMNLILLKNEQSALTLEVADGVLYEIKEQ